MAPLRVGIIGMGGYARTLHTTVQVLEKQGECVLVCTCSQRGAEAPEVEQFQMIERGAQIFTNYIDMLNACEIDIIVIPTPVDQHAPMHAECVRRGLAIYLEKPPTLNWAELQRMLTVEAAARSKCHVGFNYIVEPTRQDIKRRLLAGEFGRVQGVSLAVAWPRSSAYFARASWGGALVGDESGELILDSCMGNACAHHVFNSLFWCGGGELLSWADVTEVRAELYRAHDIQGTDTTFVVVTTKTGIPIRITITHACAIGDKIQEEVVQCEHATVRYDCDASGGSYRIEPNSTGSDALVKQTESWKAVQGNLSVANFRDYFSYVRGEKDRPLILLKDTSSFVSLMSLIYVSAGTIRTIDEPFLERSVEETKTSPMQLTTGEFVRVNGLRDVMETFCTTGLLPSEQTGVGWGEGGSSAAGLGEIGELEDTVATMVTAWEARGRSSTSNSNARL